MPWDTTDANRFTKKAISKKKKRQWAEVANTILGRGGSEASAIRQANAVIKRSK